MMITINLAEAPRRRRGLPPATTVAVAAMAATVLLLTVWSIVLVARVAHLHHELDDAAREIGRLRPVAQQVAELDRIAGLMRRRQGLLQQLLATRMPASEALEGIREMIPQSVWLTGVTMDAKRKVTLSGYTFSYPSVAHFMVELRGSSRFRNIDLTSTEKATIAERQVVKFEITGELRAAPPAASRTRRTP